MFGKKKSDGQVGRFSLKHIQGLDIPETVCAVTLCEDKININGGGKDYTLSLSKIVLVSYEMEVDVKKYAKSSKSAGIAGAAVAGTAGAIIASSPKTKTERLVTGAVLIGYRNSEDPFSYIVFEDPQPNDKQAAKFVDKLKPLVQETAPETIEL